MAVARVTCLMKFGNVRTGGDVSASFCKLMGFKASSLKDPDGFGWSFCSFAFKNAAMRAKFG